MVVVGVEVAVAVVVEVVVEVAGVGLEGHHGAEAAQHQQPKLPCLQSIQGSGYVAH